MTKVVITGGSGFVGQYLQSELQASWSDAALTVFDLPEIDITKPATFSEKISELQPDWVVHLAALAKVGDSVGQEERYNAVNVGGTEILLETIQKQSPATKTLVVSSADVYGKAGFSGEPVAELSPGQCQPQNPYAESKLAMEKMVAEKFLDNTIVVRPFPHIGPKQQEGFVTADFAKQVAELEKKGGGEISVGNLGAKRDFTDVRDVVCAYRLLMEQGKLGETYNIASGKAVAVQEILNKFLSLSSAQIEVKQDPERMRPSDIPVLVGDASKLKEATSWQSEISLDQSLQEVLAYWRAQ